MENKLILIEETIFYEVKNEPTPQRLLEDVALMIEKGFVRPVIFWNRYDPVGDYTGFELTFSQYREETEQEKEKRTQREKDAEERSRLNRLKLYEELRQEFGE